MAAQATHPEETKRKRYTSDEAEALFLEQLKRTNPDEAVKAIIRELEAKKYVTKSRRSRKVRGRK